MVVNCDSLEQVREKIDGLDRQIVGLIAERGAYVSQAARFKKDSDAVRAPVSIFALRTCPPISGRAMYS